MVKWRSHREMSFKWSWGIFYAVAFGQEMDRQFLRGSISQYCQRMIAIKLPRIPVRKQLDCILLCNIVAKIDVGISLFPPVCQLAGREMIDTCRLPGNPKLSSLFSGIESNYDSILMRFISLVIQANQIGYIPQIIVVNILFNRVWCSETDFKLFGWWS